MSIPASAFDPSRRLDLYFRIKRAGVKVFIFVDAAGAAIDISAFAFAWRLKQYAGARTNVIELTIGAGLTVGGAGNNELSAALTVANTSISDGEYYHELIKGSTSKTYLNGKGIAHNGLFDGVGSDTSTLTITDGSDAVTIQISEAGAAGATSVGLANEIAARAAQDVILQNNITAGDNPFNIVEVPGDIATFTVLLAHKNCVLNFRSDTDFTVLLSSVIGVNDFFCYIKMKGAGKPTLLADTGYTLDVTSPTIFTTEGGATVYYEGSNVFSAEGGLGQVSLEILEPVSSTGVVVKFDIPRSYGYNTPETGDITLDITGMIEGLTQLMVHNDAGEPTYPAEFKTVVGTYVNNVDNYIYMHAIKPTKIHVSIVQEP